jgi:hypothetical protein
MASKKTGLKIELPIKDNNGVNLIIDDINQDIWDKIEGNIYDTNKNISSIAGMGLIRANSTIFFKELPYLTPNIDIKNLISITKFPEVPDVCRYKITKTGSNFIVECCERGKMFQDSSFDDDDASEYSKKKRNNKGVILLILESPHKDEYDDNFDPIAPANGTTGCAIQCKIKRVLEKIITIKNIKLVNKTYYLIISNPVPYQTSLNYFSGGSSTEGIKFDVWKEIWSIKAIKLKFINKIKTYNPDLIINACTGKNKDNKKDNNFNFIITDFISNKFKKVKMVTTYHPSTVHFNEKKDFGLNI